VRLLRALAASFSYFSIFPGRTADVALDEDAVAVLPIVGLLIGAAVGWAAYGMFVVTHSSVVAAIVAWILSIALSGAIHVDGFLDCCDGLFAMVSPERRLEIMRDPHHGTYAIVGMAIVSVLWLYALMQIAPTTLPLALAMAAAMSRFAGTAAAIDRWKERSTGDMEERVARGGFSVLAFAAAFWLFFAYYRGSKFWAEALGLGVPLVVGGAFRLFASSRLNGKLTGDCYGAMIVVTEVALLLVFPVATALR
jgi:adenosylcobinamide-GDP ribazoletransferase